MTGPERKAVLFLITPPESCRDASIDTIRRVIRANADHLLEGIVQEIHRSFTSEPEDPSATRNAIDALEAVHADLVKRRRENGR